MRSNKPGGATRDIVLNTVKKSKTKCLGINRGDSLYAISY